MGGEVGAGLPAVPILRSKPHLQAVAGGDRLVTVPTGLARACGFDACPAMDAGLASAGSVSPTGGKRGAIRLPTGDGRGNPQPPLCRGLNSSTPQVAGCKPSDHPLRRRFCTRGGRQHEQRSPVGVCPPARGAAARPPACSVRRRLADQQTEGARKRRLPHWWRKLATNGRWSALCTRDNATSTPVAGRPQRFGSG